MALIYRCDRCKTTAEPGPSTRQAGPDGPPPPPLRWATRSVAGTTQAAETPMPRIGKSVLLCGDCDTSLAAWLNRPDPTSIPAQEG